MGGKNKEDCRYINSASQIVTGSMDHNCRNDGTSRLIHRPAITKGHPQHTYDRKNHSKQVVNPEIPNSIVIFFHDYYPPPCHTILSVISFVKTIKVFNVGK